MEILNTMSCTLITDYINDIGMSKAAVKILALIQL